MAKSAKSAKKKTAAKGGGRTAKSAGRAAKSTTGRKMAGAARTSRGSSKAAGGSRKGGGGSRKAAASTRGGGGAGRRPNAAFMAPVTPSPQLSEVVGAEPLPRTELTKRLWAYIKKNGLQDQNNKRMIKADDRLRPIFGKAQVNMFEMTSLVNKHVK
jgi:chromatin remodeling complex protein RSC6